MVKKTLATIIFMLVASLSFFLQLAGAETLYKVGTDRLNVRAQPDHQAEVLASLSQGSYLTGFKEQNGWIQTYIKGKEAWVASQYLIKSSKTIDRQANPQAGTAKKVTIIGDGVRLRSGPDLRHSIVGFANKGNQYEIVNESHDWLQIRKANGSTAWVAAWLTNHQISQTIANQQTAQAQPAKQANSSSQSLSHINVVLDAGHGGIDPGSLSLNNQFEKELTLRTTKAVANRLRQAGANVIMTRTEDSTVPLETRVKISHAYLTDVFISLHYDAFESSDIQGISTHYYGSSGSLNLAQVTQAELARTTGLKNRGIMNSPFHVLRNNKNLAILVELGFITNPRDLSHIEQAQHPDQVAEAITQALIKYFK